MYKQTESILTSTRFFWSLLPVPLPRKHSIPFSAQPVSTLHSVLKARLLQCSRFQDSCQQLQTFQAPRQLRKRTGKKKGFVIEQLKQRLFDSSVYISGSTPFKKASRWHGPFFLPTGHPLFCAGPSPVTVMVLVHVSVCWGWAGESPPRCMFSAHNC